MQYWHTLKILSLLTKWTGKKASQLLERYRKLSPSFSSATRKRKNRDNDEYGNGDDGYNEIVYFSESGDDNNYDKL
ncbi:hypothetical protein F8M41_025349 [Gigaspora margarita]|uniref:Uncharacterized protein n=1 Tax=Gigaspora margarita TaxID=4874 RepID=A0A8H4B508_GIGMA|nr:hypothetical protein F8M41_025349 [Gigaspora margarita]